MCGICGWIKPSGFEMKDLIRMNRAASHRGPDDEGYWVWNGGSNNGQFISRSSVDESDASGVAAFCNRRLAILDLSEAGRQPMSSKNGLLWITFNGEIYNYVELRNELLTRGCHFHTETDTEVILAAYEYWRTECFQRFNGMWAMAIADLQNRTLILSRDRLGVKPLYVWAKNGSLAFASEIKQLMTLPSVQAIANVDALIEYIDSGYEGPPATFFEDVRAFPPASWAEVSIEHPVDLVAQRFWNPEELKVRNITTSEAGEAIRQLFADSVRLRLRSDVPVGVCLSGGLDSSAIFGQMHQLNNGSGRISYAFSAAFEESQFDERRYVEIVLRKFDGQCFYTFPTAEGFLQDFENFVYHHDEPPGSLSQYAAWCVMRLAREHQVPVLLNGQGGDELFSGYWPSYYLFLRQQSARSPLRFTRHLLGALLPGGNPTLVSEALSYLHRYQIRKNRINRDLIRTRWLSARSNAENNWALTAQKLDPMQYRINEICHVHLPRLLKWDDRNSMAFSIEGRYPFLDYRLVEWAVSLPTEMNFRRGWNKLLLRESLNNVLAPEIQWRRSKIGFETPQSVWMAAALRPALSQWVQYPSEMLAQIIDSLKLKELANRLFARQKLHKMNEGQKLLMRLFFLDQWFKVFRVNIP